MDEIISMAYGNGGKKTSELLEECILPYLNNEKLAPLGDGALLKTEKGLAFSTDSFVVYPTFFPGGDIGKLSVCGTVNDLLMCGAVPKYLSLALIIEEGLSTKELQEIIKSVNNTAKEAGVQIVTGDTKVVDRGHGHGVFINTTGIGELKEGIRLGKERIEAGDKVIVTGSVGNHGVAILCAREKLLEGDLVSDCMPLCHLAEGILKYGEHVKLLRDPTRGGIATTLNEFTEEMNFGIELWEEKIPVDPSVKTACDLLGIDPLYSANEGKILAVVSPEMAGEIVEGLHRIPGGEKASIIGEVKRNIPSRVVLKGEIGGSRILDKLTNNLLPRIC